MVETSGMFKKIKSLFVHEDENSGTPVIITENSNLGQDADMKVSSPTNSPTNSGEVEPKFLDLLFKAIEANNLDGFDYLEYKNSLKSIQNVIPDEGMRYKSAFEMAKTMGLTKDKLLQSAGHYLNILVEEDKKFKSAVENQKEKQIKGRADQIQNFEKGIAEKQEMIEKLHMEIESSKKQLDAFRSEINDAVVKIDETNQQFVASYNLVYGQLKDDIEKIKSNI